MLARRLVDSLYVEAMLLADEARGYFDRCARAGQSDLSPMTSVLFSCESLKVTTRLMHSIAWLLTQRGVHSGEIAASNRGTAQRLGPAIESDTSTLVQMPDEARLLIEASIELFRRIERIDRSIEEAVVGPSPARRLMQRLEKSF